MRCRGACRSIFGERIARDGMIARPAVGELAFIEQYLGKIEARTCKVAVERQKRRDRTRPAVQPGQRNVRDEGAGFGREANAREPLIDLAMQRGDRFVRFDSGPDHMRPPIPLEQVDAGDPRRNSRRMEGTERRGDVFGAVMVDLTDEAKRQVKLLVVLPARARNAVHRADQQRANGPRWAQGDKQAVRRHRASIRRLVTRRDPPAVLHETMPPLVSMSGFA